MNSKELKEQRALIDVELDKLEKEFEGTEPTDEQRSSYDSKLEEGAKLDEKIKFEEKVEKEKEARATRHVKGGLGKTEDRELDDHKKKLDVGQAIFDMASGRQLQGRAAELNQEAIREFRGYAPNTFNVPQSVMSANLEKRTDIDQATSAIQATQLGSYERALRERSLYNNIGIRITPGLTDDLKIPIIAKQAVAWATAENSAAADGGANATSKTLAPVRVTGKASVSTLLELQNPGLMNELMFDFGAATGALIDVAMFATADVTNSPGSIAGTTGVNTFTETATYAANVSIFADYVLAEQEQAAAQGLSGNLAYVGATNLLADLKKSAQVVNVNPGITGNLAFNQQMVNGYRSYHTVGATLSAGTSGDFIFGDFSKVRMGEWGGLSIGLDPWSEMETAQVKLVLHKYVDWVLTIGDAFVKATSLVA